MIHDPNSPLTSGSAAGGVGAKLRAARMQQGRTIEDVASELHMHVKQVSTLEEERYGEFASVAFTKGYVRSYARALGLDPEPLSEELGRAGLDEPAWSTHVPVEVARPNKWLLSVGSVVVVALLAGLSIAWLLGSGAWDQLRRHGDAEESGSTEQAAVSAGIAVGQPAGRESLSAPPAADTATIPAPVANGDVRPASSEPQTLFPSADTQQTQATAPAIAAPLPGATAIVTPAATPAPPAANEAVAPETNAGASQGKDRVRISLTEDCWVEIYDSERNKVIYGLYKAGESKEAAGNAPFQVFLGFARGVTLEYNGKPFDVAQYTKSSQTARFALVNE